MITKLPTSPQLFEAELVEEVAVALPKVVACGAGLSFGVSDVDAGIVVVGD